MPTKYPPLPELEISEMTKKVLDQSTIDAAVQMIYESHPDLLARLAQMDILTEESMDMHKKNAVENERQEQMFSEIAEELNHVIKVEVVPKLALKKDIMISGSIFWEVRRRTRLMYGLKI